MGPGPGPSMPTTETYIMYHNVNGISWEKSQTESDGTEIQHQSTRSEEK